MSTPARSPTRRVAVTPARTPARSPARRAAASPPAAKQEAPPASKREASPRQLADRVKDLESAEKEAKKSQPKDQKQRQREFSDAKKRISKEFQAAKRVAQKGDREASRIATKAGQAEKQAELAKANLGRLRAKRHGVEAALHEKVSGVGESHGRLTHAAVAAVAMEVEAEEAEADAPEEQRSCRLLPRSSDAADGGSVIVQVAPPETAADAAPAAVEAGVQAASEADEDMAELKAENCRLRDRLREALEEIARLMAERAAPPADSGLAEPKPVLRRAAGSVSLPFSRSSSPPPVVGRGSCGVPAAKAKAVAATTVRRVVVPTISAMSALSVSSSASPRSSGGILRQTSGPVCAYVSPQLGHRVVAANLSGPPTFRPSAEAGASTAVAPMESHEMAPPAPPAAPKEEVTLAPPLLFQMRTLSAPMRDAKGKQTAPLVEPMMFKPPPVPKGEHRQVVTQAV